MFRVTREKLQLKPDIRDFNASFALFKTLRSFKILSHIFFDILYSLPIDIYRKPS